MGTAVVQWLRCCATNRKVAGSIPASDHTMALGSTQPLTEMSTRRKGSRCIRLTNLPPSCAVVMKSVNLNFLEPFGPLQACNGTDLPLLVVRSTEELWGHRKWCVYEKTAICNRHLISARWRLICCEGTVIEVNLPEDGVNKQRNA